MTLHSATSRLEKLVTFRFLFLYGSFIFIFEATTIFFLNKNITMITFDFIKNQTGYILISILIFSLLANILPATLSYIFSMICKNREIIKFEKDNYIEKDILLSQALKNQNSVDYLYLQNHKSKEINLSELKNYALLFSFSIFINYLFDNSIMKNIEIYLNTNMLLSLFISVLLISLFLFIQMVLCDFTDKIYYPIDKE